MLTLGGRTSRGRLAPRLLLAKALLSVGVFYGPDETPGQPSIRVTPATASACGAITPYLVRSKRPGRHQESTHRTNGALV